MRILIGRDDRIRALAPQVPYETRQCHKRAPHVEIEDAHARIEMRTVFAYALEHDRINGNLARDKRVRKRHHYTLATAGTKGAEEERNAHAPTVYGACRCYAKTRRTRETRPCLISWGKSRAMADSAQKLSVIVPAFNEAATIREVLLRTATARLPDGWLREVIVVDDGSTDETRHVLAEVPDGVHVLYRNRNGGKGAAVKDGLRAATGSHCIIQDADLELDPGEHINLLAPVIANEAQATFGRRILKGSGLAHLSILFLGGRIVSWYYDLLFGRRFADIPCCFKLFPRACIPALLETPSSDFVFDAVEMTHVIASRCTVAEVPVTYAPRSRLEGKKISARHGIYCLIAITLMRLGLHRAPLHDEVPRLLRYLLAGLVTIGVNMAVLYALTEWGRMWYIGSSIFAFAAAYAINFSLQKWWTFRDAAAARIMYQIPMHLSLAVANLGVNTILLYSLVQFGHVWYLAAQVITAGFIAAESFVISSRFIFVP